MAKVTAKQIMLDAIALKEEKSKDYQGGKWAEEDYFPFGDLSFMHMIHTKYLRMRNIMERDVINFEGLDDTLIDMINYCAMYAAWLQNEKMKEFEDTKFEVTPEEEKAFKTMEQSIKEQFHKEECLSAQAEWDFGQI